MVLIIFSNRLVCCGNVLTPAPTIIQSNFSLESVSQRALSAVSPRSRRQICTSYPSSTSLLFASCVVACTRLASQWMWSYWNQLTGIDTCKEDFFLCHIFLFPSKELWQTHYLASVVFSNQQSKLHLTARISQQ
jgi:hypothetical protein